MARTRRGVPADTATTSEPAVTPAEVQAVSAPLVEAVLALPTCRRCAVPMVIRSDASSYCPQCYVAGPVAVQP
jgi:hypothetical protein